jgi:hypothetical protein
MPTVNSNAPAWVQAEATHRHYKGGWYKVLGEARHTETEEIMVVYEHLFPHERGLFVRPYNVFHGTVADGRKRFQDLRG